MNSPHKPQRNLLDSQGCHDLVQRKESNSFVHPTVLVELKAMFNLAWPVALATIARMAMYNTDAAFLGHLGVDQLAGGSLALCIVQFIAVSCLGC